MSLKRTKYSSGYFLDYIQVSPIDQDALDHAVSIRLANTTADAFIRDSSPAFHRVLARHLSVRPAHVRLLSIQDLAVPTPTSKPPSASRHRPGHRVRLRRLTIPRNEQNDLDLLFTVSRGESRGYHRPNFVRQRLEQHIAEISNELGLEVK
jgi:hypothetical protein